ncbi:putative zinc-binding protein [Desulfosediminicola sp.]|uniref:putative zinc-binding protein n=1 Tax=Desulfosediminicola sp. TaxID=2886825 RepID=UPI003AF2A744
MDKTYPKKEILYILPCRGPSNAGRLTVAATQELVLEKEGRWLDTEHIALCQKTEANGPEMPPTIIVDGCERRCGARYAEQTGLQADFHLVLSDLGIDDNDLQENFAEALILAKDGIVAEATLVTMTIPMIPGCCC